ncbi:MAG: hypothetical protein KatS3mg129_1026 [Leptospiraceae bacterium]|nr:MAG: hypothetical protein KatS3mg129_1026 [Leptospiraceae bacterium]
MVKNLQNYLLLLLVLLNFCTKPFSQKLEIGEIYNPNFTEYKIEDIDQIYLILTRMFNAIEKKDLSLIKDFISEEKGIYVDLKAWKSRKDFLNEIQQPDSYINNVYLHTDSLIKETNDTTQISLYDLIKESKKIKADFYILTDRDCEVKLIILDNPKESYRFNNPYFIKIKDKWYIYRLF